LYQEEDAFDRFSKTKKKVVDIAAPLSTRDDAELEAAAKKTEAAAKKTEPSAKKTEPSAKKTEVAKKTEAAKKTEVPETTSAPSAVSAPQKTSSTQTTTSSTSIPAPAPVRAPTPDGLSVSVQSLIQKLVPWTAAEQKLLETALSTYPTSLRYGETNEIVTLESDRWDKVAACIPGMTKKDCIARYKFLVSQIKEKKGGKVGKITQKSYGFRKTIEDRCESLFASGGVSAGWFGLCLPSKEPPFKFWSGICLPNVQLPN
jgi:hypothetical protein